MKENVYATSDFAHKVGISKASVKNYVSILEQSGYEISRDHRQYRQFTDHDIVIFKALITLKNRQGMKLKEAAEVVAAPDFQLVNVQDDLRNDVIVEKRNNAVELSRYNDLCQSMELLASHVYGIEQQNAQLLELIQAQRTQNELLMEQNVTLKQELGTMMNSLIEKANEPEQNHVQQLNRVELQNNAIMAAVNRLNVEQHEKAAEVEVRSTQQGGFLSRLMKK